MKVVVVRWFGIALLSALAIACGDDAPGTPDAEPVPIDAAPDAFMATCDEARMVPTLRALPDVTAVGESTCGQYVDGPARCFSITIEQPIEFLHKHRMAIVNQREVGEDTTSFERALRYALRQDPDVLVVGELPDVETIRHALAAAETGQLVLATLRTVDAVKTIDRIVDVFPVPQQPQVRLQLATSLRGIVVQQLVPALDGGVALADLGRCISGCG